MRTILTPICLLALVTSAVAQDAPAQAAAAATSSGPLSAHTRGVYRGVKAIVLRSAELMPDTSYSFRPAKSVRTYSELVGHIADSQYAFCSAVLGEERQGPASANTRRSKAELVAALKEAFSYCDRAYDGVTDATATQMVKHMGGDAPKLGVLNVNNVHTIEHYGNLLTYMRMKNIVPPTSDKEFMKQLMKK